MKSTICHFLQIKNLDAGEVRGTKLDWATEMSPFSFISSDSVVASFPFFQIVSFLLPSTWPDFHQVQVNDIKTIFTIEQVMN